MYVCVPKHSSIVCMDLIHRLDTFIDLLLGGIKHDNRYIHITHCISNTCNTIAYKNLSRKLANNGEPAIPACYINHIKKRYELSKSGCNEGFCFIYFSDLK